MEYLIRNGGVKEEYYLQEIGKDKIRDIYLEDEIGRQPEPEKRKRRQKKWEWPCDESKRDEKPKGCVTATWTPDETKAKYFSSRKAAEAVIRKWPVLRNAVVVEAGI